MRSIEKAVEIMQLGVTITDQKGKILYTNHAEAYMHGHIVEELIGKDVRILAPPELWNPMTLEQIKRMKRRRRESINIRKDGSTFPVLLMSDVLMDIDEYPIGIITTCEDITERKKAEKALQKTYYELEMRVEERTAELTRVNEQLQRDIAERKQAEKKIRIYQKQLQSLIYKLALLEERERKCISEELHDNIGQNLALSKIKIATLRESKSSTDIANELDEIRELIELAIQFTRSLTLELSPRILYELGFEAAIRWLTEQIQKKHGITVDFVSDGNLKKLNNEMSVLLFKTLRELLINTIKHAKAHNAKVVMWRDDNDIRINYEDDGIGFDISKIFHYSLDTESFGLFSIGERIKYLGGTIEITSRPGQGTKVTLAAPIEQNTNKR